MVVCQYFLKGKCRYGNNCRNEVRPFWTPQLCSDVPRSTLPIVTQAQVRLALHLALAPTMVPSSGNSLHLAHNRRRPSLVKTLLALLLVPLVVSAMRPLLVEVLRILSEVVLPNNRPSLLQRRGSLLMFLQVK